MIQGNAGIVHKELNASWFEGGNLFRQTNYLFFDANIGHEPEAILARGIAECGAGQSCGIMSPGPVL
jgi:hypothetical protein